MPTGPAKTIARPTRPHCLCVRIVAGHTASRLARVPAATSTKICPTVVAAASKPDSHDPGWPAPNAGVRADPSSPADRSPIPDCAGGSRDAMFQLPSGFQNQIVVLLQRSGNVAFPDRHLSSTCPPPVEVMRNRPAPSVRHDRFQADHFVFDPRGLGLGENPAGQRGLPTDVWPSPSCWPMEPLHQPSEPSNIPRQYPDQPGSHRAGLLSSLTRCRGHCRQTEAIRVTASRSR